MAVALATGLSEPGGWSGEEAGEGEVGGGMEPRRLGGVGEGAGESWAAPAGGCVGLEEEEEEEEERETLMRWTYCLGTERRMWRARR